MCHSFINYGSIYQAMNARGEWQYIVNLKPWTQTGIVLVQYILLNLE